MACFLKKSNLKKGLYLQIYESFYNPDKKQTDHRSHKALGYVSNLIADGIPEPISHYSLVVQRMNDEVKASKQKDQPRQIDQSPERYLGYFLVQAVYDSLKVDRLQRK